MDTKYCKKCGIIYVPEKADCVMCGRVLYLVTETNKVMNDLQLVD